MKGFKTLIAMIAAVAMLGGSTANAQQVTDAGGYGYVQSKRTSSLSPAIALGTIALVAIVAVAIQNTSHGHSH